MDLKRTSSSKKKLNQSHTSCSLPKKKSSSKQKKQKKTQNSVSVIQAYADGKKKKEGSGLVKKKKIEDLKTPQLLIKVSYKGKKLSIPLTTIPDSNLSETILPHIIRFEKQILRNPEFNPAMIETWKTTLSTSDILKDYYFQTNKTLHVFQGQALEIQPVWKRLKNQTVKLGDFEIIRCIGTGGFSRVYLARYKITGRFFALKLMEKDGLLETGKECVVINQRDIMVELDNPQILNLQFAFETKHFVVLALEYCPGGELFYYLRKVRRMTEDEARYCFVEILMGIQYLHSKKIIYRDIKPENIMIDKDGNLKIADFGLSRHGIKPSELAFTYCGSPEYMAPQMLTKSGHTFSVDYYCLGALLYELVTGNPPFYSRDVEKIYYSIQNEEIDFPPHVQLSDQIKMLLQGLLIKDPKRRLGNLGGIREILAHPWVRKIKPTDISNKVLETPVKVDLLAFNINEEQIQEAEDNFTEKLNDEGNDFQEMFQGFYFNRHESLNILDEALPSVKSESTKQNRSLNQKLPHNIREPEKPPYKSQSRDKPPFSSNPDSNKYSITFKPESMTHKGFSELRTHKPQKKHNLKKNKSKKQLDLIQRSRKRNEKSLGRVVEARKSKEKARFGSPKPGANKGLLKRIKSSTGLHGGAIMQSPY